jgi:hypothetical protein
MQDASTVRFEAMNWSEWYNKENHLNLKSTTYMQSKEQKT